jgi:hypothetical protein
MNLGQAMAGGKGAKEALARPRERDDFYPTPPEVTEALWLAENKYLGKKGLPAVIWEPACGDGAICKALERHDHDVVATDLVYRGYGHGEIDFLKRKSLPKEAPDEYIITNPPFNLAAQFIDHALGTLKVSYLALLLKSTFFHADGRMALYERFTPSVIYPLTWRPDFMGLGAPTMECAWFVWRRPLEPTRRPEYQPIRRPGAAPLMPELL